jgi:hypothetical protein
VNVQFIGCPMSVFNRRCQVGKRIQDCIAPGTGPIVRTTVNSTLACACRMSFLLRTTLSSRKCQWEFVGPKFPGILGAWTDWKKIWRSKSSARSSRGIANHG